MRPEPRSDNAETQSAQLPAEVQRQLYFEPLDYDSLSLVRHRVNNAFKLATVSW